MAGLFGEDGMALVDLWHPEQGARRILSGYGKGEEKLPVYRKCPTCAAGQWQVNTLMSRHWPP